MHWLIGRIWKQKGIYEGQTCYLIGDGPSVKWINFKDLPKYKAITCNMFPMHNQFNELDVLVNIMVCPFWFAPMFMRKHRDYLVKSHNLSIGYRDIVKSNPAVDFIFNITNAPFISGVNVNFVGKYANYDREDLARFKWFTGGFYSLLGIAEYLGFKRAIIIGCDSWALIPAHKGHWYEAGLSEELIDTDTYRNLKESVKLRTELQAIGINHKKKSIPIIDYEEFTGCKPIYRDNKMLLSEKNFKLLSTDASYILER